jgi:hypothetical protein
MSGAMAYPGGEALAQLSASTCRQHERYSAHPRGRHPNSGQRLTVLSVAFPFATRADAVGGAEQVLSAWTVRSSLGHRSIVIAKEGRKQLDIPAHRFDR